MQELKRSILMRPRVTGHGDFGKSRRSQSRTEQEWPGGQGESQEKVMSGSAQSEEIF